jgi:hypothetical protein
VSVTVNLEELLDKVDKLDPEHAVALLLGTVRALAAEVESRPTGTIDRPDTERINRSTFNDRQLGPVEFADGVRVGTFPEDWGYPDGRMYSKEREAWIRSRIDPTKEHYRQLDRHSARLAAIVRNAELEQRR